MALRRRAAQRSAGSAQPPPPPPPPAPRVRRPLTPAQAVLVDGATLAGLTAIVVGFVLIGLGWRGVAGTVDVQVQLSYLTSGGLGGMVVIGIGCGLLVMQGDRFVDALENRAWQQLAREWRALGTAVTAMGEALEREAAIAATDRTQELPRLATPWAAPVVPVVPAPADPPPGVIPTPDPPTQGGLG